MTILDWISANAKIRNAIKWEREPRETLDFAAWTEEMRNDLLRTYNLAKQHAWLFVPDPPENLKLLDDDDFYDTRISPQDAWDIYIAYIAHSLAVEVKQWVSWSILDYDNDDLYHLFDSRAFFTCKIDGDLGKNYSINYWTTGNATPGTPSLPWILLKHTTKIEDTPEETVGNLLQWCRENMVHFGGAPSGRDYPTASHDCHWHYRGYAPVSRVILGTKRVYDNDELNVHLNETETRHFTAGCHGTNGFLRCVLRTVNIPVLYERYAHHAIPYLPTIEMHLSHGDDPYNRNVRSAGYPSSYLLMSDSDYDSVFTDQDEDDGDNQNSAHIGSHVRQLTLKWLPINLLDKRIKDGYESDRRTNVLEMFKDSYGKWLISEEELEEARLWERMDEKIKAYGGPDKVPGTYDGDYLWDSWKQVLIKMKIMEQRQIRQQARRDYSKMQKKMPDLSSLKRKDPALSSNIQQLMEDAQTSQPPQPRRKRSRPPLKEPARPKDKPRRKPHRRKRAISERPKKPPRKPPAKKKKPVTKKDAPKKKKPAKKPAPKKDKETTEKKKKPSIRKRVTKGLRKVVRRG